MPEQYFMRAVRDLGEHYTTYRHVIDVQHMGSVNVQTNGSVQVGVRALRMRLDWFTVASYAIVHLRLEVVSQSCETGFHFSHYQGV